MELKKGYKQTEIGIIPEDWEVKKVKSFTSVKSGGTPNTQISEYWDGTIRWMNSGELNLKTVFEVKNRITELGLKNSATNLLPKHCILIGLAGQGKTRGTVAKNEIELCTNQSIATILPSEHINYVYLYFNLDSRYFELRGLSTGDGGRAGLNLNLISNILIPIPSIKEQTAIANALTDIDDLISSLEEKIVKKKNIKQGAMQELLKPKEGWVEKRLGEVVIIKKGQMITSSDFIKGTTPVIAGGMTLAGYHSISNRKANTITISASGANAGFVAFHKYPIFASDCSTIEEDVNCNILFIYYFLKLKQIKIYKLQTGGAQPHIHPKDLNPIIIFYPDNIKKQNEIAMILLDMDKEIEGLEGKLEKYRMIKEGMMKDLLTGRIRLI